LELTKDLDIHKYKTHPCGHETQNEFCEICAGRAGIKTKVLRPYQRDVIRAIYDKFTKGCNSLVLCLPTGAGKTKTVSEIVAQIYKKRQKEGKVARFLCLSHRDFLRSQMAEAISEVALGSQVEIIQGKHKGYEKLIQVSTIQTLNRRKNNLPPADLVVVDEAHRAKAKQYNEILDIYKSKGARILGLTATPVRLDKKPLNDVFDDIAVGISIRELIKLGMLVKPRVFSKYCPDLKRVGKRSGDFKDEELEEIMNCSSSNKHIVEEYIRLATGKKAIMFCVSVAHCNALAEKFNENGISAAVLTGKTPKKERERILAEFKSGIITILVNCEIATEGFDVPDVDVIGLNRPTKSLTLYLQQIGRGLRPFPGKTELIVLDHSGNTEEHGFADDLFPWELFFKTGYNQPDRLNTKTCPECFFVIPSNEQFCPNCNHSFARLLPGGHTQKMILDLPLNEMVSFCLGEEKELTSRILRVIEKARGYKRGWNLRVIDEGDQDRSFYYNKFFREILKYEKDECYEFSPVNPNDIALAKTLDEKSVHYENFRNYNQV